MCAQGKSHRLERVCNSPLLPEPPSVLGLGAPGPAGGEELLRKLALESLVEAQVEEGSLQCWCVKGTRGPRGTTGSQEQLAWVYIDWEGLG